MTNKIFILLLALVLLAILSAILACTPSPTSFSGCGMDCMEGSSQVETAVLYRHINYVDDAPIKVNNLGDITSLDGDMSSLKVHPDFEVVLFEGADLTGGFTVLTGEIPSLFDSLFNDRARSLTYRRKIPVESKLLPSFFTDQHFRGQEVTIPYGTTVLKERFYAASITVPKGLRVIVTTLVGARFSEQTHVVTSDVTLAPFIGKLIASVVVEMV